MPLNNDYLRQIANSVGQGDTSGARVLNNEYLRRIAEGIGGIVDPSSGKVDASKIEGVIPAANLPSYVDDVIEGYLYEGAFYTDTNHEYEIEPESGKIYVDVSDDTSYRWTGTAYVSMGAPYTLPTMSPTTIGGAKLGDGLAITDGALGIDPDPQESTGAVRGAVSSLTAKGWATQDGTPTPSSPVPIQVARGRNLYREAMYSVGQTWSPVNTLTVTKRGYNEYSISGNSTGTHWLYGGGGDLSDGLFVNLGAGTYVASLSGDASNLTIAVRGRDGGAQTTIASGASPLSFTLAEATDVKVTAVTIANKTFSNQRCTIQLELGSTAHNYVPYGYVGIDVTHNGTTTTIPVPLPSKGYAAALPDGTADVLTIDGAGKVEWLSAVARIESYAGESVGAVYLSTTGELTTDAEVYYPLVTPAKEQVGYIDWPSIPDVAIITCPELDALGVRYLIGNGVAEMAQDWYERGHTEAQSNATAIGELAQSVLDVDGKADAVAAQLVAEDVSSAFTFVQGSSFAITSGTGRKKVCEALGFVWFNLEFSVAAGTTLSSMVVVAEVDTAMLPAADSNTKKVALQTNVPKMRAEISFGYYATYVYLVPQESSVTMAGGDTVYSITGSYYVG